MKCKIEKCARREKRENLFSHFRAAVADAVGVKSAQGDPGKAYEANAATKNLFFDIAEPKGIAPAQQVRGDRTKRDKRT